MCCPSYSGGWGGTIAQNWALGLAHAAKENCKKTLSRNMKRCCCCSVIEFVLCMDKALGSIPIPKQNLKMKCFSWLTPISLTNEKPLFFAIYVSSLQTPTFAVCWEPICHIGKGWGTSCSQCHDSIELVWCSRFWFINCKHKIQKISIFLLMTVLLT